jgi:PAS domain S-box-containing protein
VSSGAKTTSARGRRATAAAERLSGRRSPKPRRAASPSHPPASPVPTPALTDLERAEDALRESETRYQAVVDTAREMICTATPDGRFTSMNPAFEALTGFPRADWLGRPFAEILHPDDVATCVAAFEAGVRGESPPTVTHRVRSRTGGWLTFETTVAPQLRDGRVVEVLGVARDVTARVQAEAALAESRRRLQALFDNALDAILILDARGHYVDANPAAAALLGYSRDEILSLTPLDVTPPADLSAMAVAQRSFMEHGAYSGDWRLARKDGTVVDAEMRCVANFLPGMHLAMVRDVTDRKRADEESRRRRTLLEEAEEVAHLGCWEWDVLSNAVTWSRETYRLFGVTPGKFQPRFDLVMQFVHPDDRAMVLELNERAVREGTGFAYDARIVRPSGDVRFIHARGHVELDVRGRAARMMGVVQDITEDKRSAEVRGLLISRLITVHEEERARISRELHDGAGQSLAALLVGLRHVEDAPSLAEARLAASRQRELVAQTIDDLNRLARGLRPTILDDLGLKAALVRYGEDQAWLFGFQVTVNVTGISMRRLPRDVETALFRMVQEAVSNAARHAEARHVWIHLSQEQDEAHLLVRDDGCGFDELVPPAGGLGLHGIRERAALLGGRSEIRSRPGEGTEVEVTIPVPSRGPVVRTRP